MRSLYDRPDLTTARLQLREPSMEDIDAIVEICGQWDVARRLAAVPHPYKRQDALYFLEQIVPRDWCWGITLTGSPELIGMVGLTPHRDQHAALGYWLSPLRWGKGIMTEAAQRVVTYGFTHLGLTSIGSDYHADNPASGQVLRKLGFIEVGRGLHPCLAQGGDVPSIMMHLAPPAN